MKQTTNLKLNKPEHTDPADITQLNENWDKIDDEITTHEQRQDNPHNVTKEQLGIDLTGFEEHIANKSNPHEVTAAQVNAVSKNGDTMNGTLVIKDGSLKIEHGTVGHGGIGTEIYGLNNNGDANAHHFLDISHVCMAALMRLRFNVEENGGLYKTKHAVQFRQEILNGAGTWYNIFHSGNKPTGSYLGNGSSTKRTIDTGGIGNVLFIWANSQGDTTATQQTKIYVLPTGAVAFGSDNASDRGVTSAEMKYENGVLTITNNRNWFNQSGITYYYQCL